MNYNNFNKETIKIKVKKLVSKSKKNNIIKSHIQAFEDIPVKYEEHKGNINSYLENYSCFLINIKN